MQVHVVVLQHTKVRGKPSQGTGHGLRQNNYSSHIHNKKKLAALSATRQIDNRVTNNVSYQVSNTPGAFPTFTAQNGIRDNKWENFLGRKINPKPDWTIYLFAKTIKIKTNISFVHNLFCFRIWTQKGLLQLSDCVPIFSPKMHPGGIKNVLPSSAIFFTP